MLGIKFRSRGRGQKQSDQRYLQSGYLLLAWEEREIHFGLEIISGDGGQKFGGKFWMSQIPKRISLEKTKKTQEYVGGDIILET